MSHTVISIKARWLDGPKIHAIIRKVMDNPLQAPVLVLNANFEPLNVCNTRRAIVLVLTGKASMILDGRGEIQGVSKAFPCPSIIRLERMIKRPRPKVKLTKREILRRDNYTCQYCGRQVPQLTIDHILPRRLGGRHEWDNVVAACPSCNHLKGGRTVEQAQMKLTSSPNEPPSSALYIFAKHINENEDWKPFVEGW